MLLNGYASTTEATDRLFRGQINHWCSLHLSFGRGLGCLREEDVQLDTCRGWVGLLNSRCVGARGKRGSIENYFLNNAAVAASQLGISLSPGEMAII